jgi:hypothetical protein
VLVAVEEQHYADVIPVRLGHCALYRGDGCLRPEKDEIAGFSGGRYRTNVKRRPAARL